MIRYIVIGLAALAVFAGAASAHAFFKITANGTHIDGARAGISADAVSAVVLPAGPTVTVH